jgi:DNA-binding NarL/FixJ family response regulator
MMNPMAETNAPIRILTVDDHELLRDGIRAVIANQPDMIVAGEAASGRESIEAFARLRPDITLMDLRLPDMSGIDAIASIRGAFPLARIIVLTTYTGDVQAQRALKAGASGYLLKNMLRKDLIETIRAVHAGKRSVPAAVAMEMAEYAGADGLTPRELEVLRQVAGGNSNKVIAELLSITEDTVKAHVKSILSKLAATDRTHAVMIGVRRGILDV